MSTTEPRTYRQGEICTWCNLFNNTDVMILIIHNLLIIKDYIFTKETRINVKNLLEAYPKLVLNTDIKNLIDFLIISRHISNYIAFVDDFMPKNTKKWPTSDPNGNISFSISYSRPRNANFYRSNIREVVYSDYFNYDNKIRSLIYQNIKKLFDEEDITKDNYIRLIEKLLLSKRKKFTKKLCKLIIGLNNDLKSIDIKLEHKNTIIYKLLKSFDWKCSHYQMRMM